MHNVLRTGHTSREISKNELNVKYVYTHQKHANCGSSLKSVKKSKIKKIHSYRTKFMIFTKFGTMFASEIILNEHCRSLGTIKRSMNPIKI